MISNTCIIEKIDYLLFGLLLGISIIFPTQFTALKAVFIIMYLCIRIGHLRVAGRLKFDHLNLTIPLFFSSVGLGYSAYGALLNAPGSASVLTVHTIYPLLLGYLAATATLSEAKRLVDWLGTLSMIGTLIVAALFMWLITGHDNPLLFEDATSSLNNDSGYTKLSFPLLSLLNFSVPFLIMRYALLPDRRRNILNSLLLSVAILVAIVTGRRATWLVLLFGLFFPLIFRGVGFRTIALMTIIVALGSGLAFWAGGLEWDVLVTRLGAGFEFSSMADNGSALERGIQFDALIRGFADSPIFGHGLGATAASYGSVRSIDFPWAYELTYIYYLFAVGLVGFIIYSIGLAALAYGLKLVAKRQDYRTRALPLLAGFGGFMMANATNPYLSKFDYMFVIFVPYALVVAYIRAQPPYCQIAKQKDVKITK